MLLTCVLCSFSRTLSKLNHARSAAYILTLQDGKPTVQASNKKRHSSRIRRPVDRYKPSTYSTPAKTVLNSTKKSKKPISSIGKGVKGDFSKKVETDGKESPLTSKLRGTSKRECVSFGLDSNLTEVPQNAYPVGYQHDSGVYYAIISKTDRGTIPGKASTNLNLGWYGYNGREHYQRQCGYFWLTAPLGCKFALERSEQIPIATVKSGTETSSDGSRRDLYSGVAHTSYGDIPAKVTDSCQCYYTYGGIEYQTDNFSWIIVQKTVTA